MEIFGGFMVMLSILGFFLTLLWFILPFVIFAMKGKLDRSYELLEGMDRRLAEMEKRLGAPVPLPQEPDPQAGGADSPSGAPPLSSPGE